MLREVHRHFVPHRLLLLADGGAGQEFFGERVEFMKSVSMIENQPTAYVCENFVCQLPTTDVAQLAKLLIAETAKTAK